jgi:hypothetical protein
VIPWVLSPTSPAALATNPEAGPCNFRCFKEFFCLSPMGDLFGCELSEHFLILGKKRKERGQKNESLDSNQISSR